MINVLSLTDELARFPFLEWSLANLFQLAKERF